MISLDSVQTVNLLDSSTLVWLTRGFRESVHERSNCSFIQRWKVQHELPYAAHISLTYALRYLITFSTAKIRNRAIFYFFHAHSRASTLQLFLFCVEIVVLSLRIPFLKIKYVAISFKLQFNLLIFLSIVYWKLNTPHIC